MGSAKRQPWLKFYGNDFYGGVGAAGFTLVEEAVYMRLLWACWESEDGTIPGDDATLNRISGCRDIRHWMYRYKDKVLGKFKRRADGRIYNQRLMDERAAANRKTMPLDGLPSNGLPSESKSPNENNVAAVQQRGLRARPPKPDTRTVSNSIGNISAMPLGNSDHVSDPIIPSASLSMPRENEPAKKSRNRSLKNGASLKARAIFDRSNEGIESESLSHRLNNTNYIRKGNR